MKKPITLTNHRANHLANRLERVATAKFALPATLVHQYERLQELTTLMREALADVLDETLLVTCQVVSYDGQTLMLATNQQTTANHLNYLSATLVAHLVAYDAYFANLQYLQVINSYPTPNKMV